MIRTPTNCPHCGQDRGFDSLGPITRKTSPPRLEDDGHIEKWERWDRMHCPECGKHFALLDKTVKIPHDENGGRKSMSEDARVGSDSMRVKCPNCGSVFETHGMGDFAACAGCDSQFSRFMNVVGADDE